MVLITTERSRWISQQGYIPPVHFPPEVISQDDYSSPYFKARHEVRLKWIYKIHLFHNNTGLA